MGYPNLLCFLLGAFLASLHVLLAEEADGGHQRHGQWKAGLGDRPAQVLLVSAVPGPGWCKLSPKP